MQDSNGGGPATSAKTSALPMSHCHDSSVVEPNTGTGTLFLDPDSEYCSNFGPDPSRFTQLHYNFDYFEREKM